jgi:hypothetical protein
MSVTYVTAVLILADSSGVVARAEQDGHLVAKQYELDGQVTGIPPTRGTPGPTHKVAITQGHDVLGGLIHEYRRAA